MPRTDEALAKQLERRVAEGEALLKQMQRISSSRHASSKGRANASTLPHETAVCTRKPADLPQPATRTPLQLLIFEESSQEHLDTTSW